jgi:hypothetical protein
VGIILMGLIVLLAIAVLAGLRLPALQWLAVAAVGLLLYIVSFYQWLLLTSFRIILFDRPLVLLILLCVVNLGLLSTWAMYTGWLSIQPVNRWDFLSRQSQLEQAVKDIRQISPLLRYGDYGFLNNKPVRPILLDSAQIDERQPRVWVSRTASHHDLMVFVTHKRGRAGMYGYVYAQHPEDINGREDISPLAFLGKRLNQHWWVAYNNLN